ncbi:MAG: hypothetical protein P8Q23_04320, partial [Paracoccaceae bacterium]|nr:hypothetical protein [Paracoccaceae bacterium]
MPSIIAAETSNLCKRIVALEAFQSMNKAPQGGTCTTYQGQSLTNATSCHWTFAYRDADAERLAIALWTELQNCRLGEKQPPDQQVNHPDSYALQIWHAKDAVYRLSIKDKAGLGQTYVF